ncbi:CofH family radical SAM protein [Archaeoglobus veneficus]|uniref:FO synthase, subunit 2 n=1 Tax=Archaeoglobus veneficus (strain DSM 11195 / SNP6) TaxID=693661 RepID=F2KN55_ARCVS|nr:CofH family radical SAM protein [Archaeoglobus veneficus]AEA46156.1 FO synthase, subunit 2 [Archaeoglobus veneficus SNP6]
MEENGTWTPRKIEELFSLELHELGEIANNLNDNYVTFVVNRHINYTNVCVSKCPLCAFHRESGYLMSVDEVLRKAGEAVKAGATELHIVGGHNPEVSLEYFEEMFSAIKAKFPDVVIKALTATEVHFLSKLEKCSVKEVLERLKEAGLQAMPGGGAEILDDKIRKVICPNKAKSDEWLGVMRTAHSLGIRSNATMLFGHIESIEHRAKHLYRLWKLQEETGGFVAFIPLVFHPENTRLKELGLVKEKTDLIDVLKTIAVSRIVLSNFASVRAYWVMLGEKLAQIALNYGANDTDGTLMEEKVTHAAGAKTPLYLPKERLLRLIKGAGKVPAERDTFYNILRVYG